MNCTNIFLFFILKILSYSYSLHINASVIFFRRSSLESCAIFRTGLRAPQMVLAGALVPAGTVLVTPAIGLWLDYTTRLRGLSQNYSVISAVCIRFLSCWQFNLLRFEVFWNRFSSMISLYLAPLITYSILTSTCHWETYPHVPHNRDGIDQLIKGTWVLVGVTLDFHASECHMCTFPLIIFEMSLGQVTELNLECHSKGSENLFFFHVPL